MGSQHAVEYCSIFSFIQVSSLHCDHRCPTGLILKHAGVKHSFHEAWPVVVDIENCHQDLISPNRQMKYEEACKHKIFLTEGYNQCWGITSYMLQHYMSYTLVQSCRRAVFWHIYGQYRSANIREYCFFFFILKKMGFKNPELLGLFHANLHIFAQIN